MSLRRPSPRIAANRVTIRPTTFGGDADGGRLLTAGSPSAVQAVRVHPTSAADRPAHLREEGVEYLTVHFFGPTPPDVRIRYLIDWLDFDPPKTLNVVGPPRTATGDFSTWLVDCEYVVPPQPGLA